MNEGDEDYFTKTKLKPFFSSTCYSGFDASAKDNFFKVYDQLFQTLDKEEELEEEVGVKHHVAARFGEHYACAEDVFAFYEDWKFFTTCKQFTYADLYNPKEAPNRRVKRIIEMENKKERTKERNKFNEMVRELVLKIQDKDPRYKKFILQQQ